MVNKGSNFADFAGFDPYTYARTHALISATFMGDNNLSIKGKKYVLDLSIFLI